MQHIRRSQRSGRWLVRAGRQSRLEIFRIGVPAPVQFWSAHIIKSITRREFIDGVACAVAAGAVRPPLAWAGDGQYPPALIGFRGSRNEDLKVAHSIRDGASYSMEHYPVAETTDYVVVGAGISGLSSAFFLRQLAPKSHVLILDITMIGPRAAQRIPRR